MTSPEHTHSAADPGDRLGLAIAMSAATGLGLAIAFSRMAYEGGTNGLSVTTTRALQAPVTASGWLGAALVVDLQASSIPLYFIAIPRIGALRSSMVSNVQPVVSIVAAFVLYGELFTPAQLAGGALVLGAVWWMQRGNQ